MNLKDLKNSNVLLSIFIDNLQNKEVLEETLFSISKQTYPVDLLVNHALDDSDLETLKLMLDNPKIIIRKNEDGKLVEEESKSNSKINYFLQNFEPKTFSYLFNNTFNIALNNDYEFCSIIEKFDIIGLHWFNTINDFQLENPEISMFFPIIRNTVNGVFSNLMNEASWAEGLAEEAGKLDLNLLSRFNCMSPLGAVYRIKAIKEYSENKENVYLPFKESIRLSHYYEFLMRMIYNDLKAMCIPRIGYEYRVKTIDNFKDSFCKIPDNLTMIPEENGGVTPHEAQYWMELAKKEYFFDEDRNKVYINPSAPVNEQAAK